VLDEKASDVKPVVAEAEAAGEPVAAPEYATESSGVTAESAEAQETKEAFVAEAAEASVSPVVDVAAVDPAALEAAAADLQARTVFVGGISWNLDNEWLKDEVLKGLDVTEGVNGVRIARNPMGKSKGFAFIELASAELAQKLTELSLEIDGREPEFRLSSSRAGQPPREPREPREARERPSSPRNPPSNTVWAGNVAWSVTEADLEAEFAQFGSIKRVSLPLDSESGRSRGIAYIEFEAQAAAQKAVEAGFKAAGIELGGRAVRLDFAEEKSRGASRGGFGGRGGGRGGFGQGQQRRGGGGGRDDRRGNGRSQRGSEW